MQSVENFAGVAFFFGYAISFVISLKLKPVLSKTQRLTVEVANSNIEAYSKSVSFELHCWDADSLQTQKVTKLFGVFNGLDKQRIVGLGKLIDRFVLAAQNVSSNTRLPFRL